LCPSTFGATGILFLKAIILECDFFLLDHICPILSAHQQLSGQIMNKRLLLFWLQKKDNLADGGPLYKKYIPCILSPLNITSFLYLDLLVPGARLELAWDCSRGILSP
jgi:hypothetical protein